MKKYTWVIMVIMAVALCGCGLFRAAESDTGGSDKEPVPALDMVQKSNASARPNGLDVDDNASNDNLDNSRCVLYLDDNQEWQIARRVDGDDDNNRNNRNSLSLNVATVPAVNIIVCPDRCVDRVDNTAISAGRDKPDTSNKEVVERANTIYWLIVLIALVFGIFIVWAFYEWIKKQIKELQYQIDKNKDGKLSYDEIKEYVAEKVKDLINKDGE